MQNFEDQADELQALLAIYPQEITIHKVNKNLKPHVSVEAEEASETCFSIGIPSLTDDFCSDLSLEVTINDDYPLEAIQFEITGGVQEQEVTDQWHTELDQLVQDNLGFVVVFVLIQQLSELQDQFVQLVSLQNETKKLAIKAIEDQKEQEKFRGTPVTTETFNNWKKAFDLERMPNQTVDQSLSGKQLFLQNKIMTQEGDQDDDNEDVAFVKQSFDTEEDY